MSMCATEPVRPTGKNTNADNETAVDALLTEAVIDDLIRQSQTGVIRNEVDELIFA
jgi:hypothetical protein